MSTRDLIVKISIVVDRHEGNIDLMRDVHIYFHLDRAVFELGIPNEKKPETEPRFATRMLPSLDLPDDSLDSIELPVRKLTSINDLSILTNDRNLWKFKGAMRHPDFTAIKYWITLFTRLLEENDIVDQGSMFNVFQKLCIRCIYHWGCFFGGFVSGTFDDSETQRWAIGEMYDLFAYFENIGSDSSLQDIVSGNLTDLKETHEGYHDVIRERAVEKRLIHEEDEPDEDYIYDFVVAELYETLESITEVTNKLVRRRRGEVGSEDEEEEEDKDHEAEDWYDGIGIYGE